MSTTADIKQALQRLSPAELAGFAEWLDGLLREVRGGAGCVREAIPGDAPDQPPAMTLERYRAFEENSALRHEYVNGLVYAMSGASLAHNRITRKLLALLEGYLKGGPCEPFVLDTRLEIRADSDEIVYYPDLMVACQPADWTDKCVRNPTFVVEVLSPSSQYVDLREKAMTYHRVPSIEEYLVLAQDEVRAVLHRRSEGWRPRVHARADALIECRSLKLSVPLGQVYEGTLP